MKIAGITITLNDGYKFKEWCQWYEEYKDELYVHIIVDNGSDDEYKKKLKEYFKNSIIIERTTNGACTLAYNDGIRKALEIPEIDGIMLIGNDLRMKTGNVAKLYEYLYSDDKLALVSPICLKKDSTIVEDYGAKITKFLTMDAKSSGAGKDISEIKEETHYTETVLGGGCLARPSFYREVGLQDEKLFMYSDEVDTGIRAMKAGYTLGYTKNSIAWHQHINPPKRGMRSPIAPYLIARNKVYLAKKHFGLGRALIIYCFLAVNSIRMMWKNRTMEGIIYHRFGLKGANAGLYNNMNNNERNWRG